MKKHLLPSFIIVIFALMIFTGCKGSSEFDVIIEKDAYYRFNMFRTALEYYFERGECKFFFFMSDVGPVFHLEHETCLKFDNTLENVVKITVYDDEDILLNPRIFYCKTNDFFKALYYGLLEIAKKNFSEYPICYNNLKSPVIEDYLSDIRYKNDEIQIRQKIVNGLLIVQRNGLFFCEGHSKDKWFLTEDDLFPKIKDSNGKIVLESFSLNGFSKWFNESKDVETGYQFAKKIKCKLRKDIELWWEINNFSKLI